MKQIQLVVVDDHILFRAGLVNLLNDMPEFQVVGEAGDGVEGLKMLEKYHPDVVLLDVNMPDLGGVGTVERIRKLPLKGQCKIIMLTVSKSDADLYNSISAGADAYILKNAEPEELRAAIIRVNQGMAVLSPQITRKVMDAVALKKGRSYNSGLSKRELEVLGYLAEGFNNLRIAEQLFITENTVKTHVRHILEKLNATNRAEAVSIAINKGILGTEEFN